MIEMPEFIPFPKLARLSRDMIVTEKIDGTNAQVHVTPDGVVLAGSRTRWITPGKNTDNHGFAAWVKEHEDELRLLGPGSHFGEWWGPGIQRGYGLAEKRFSLFNVSRWDKERFADARDRPACCDVVPTLYIGDFNTSTVDTILQTLQQFGSQASPGFMRPEGVVVFHVPSRHLFKKTLDKNDENKGDTPPENLEFLLRRSVEIAKEQAAV